MLHPVVVSVLTVERWEPQCEDIMCPEGSAAVLTSPLSSSLSCSRLLQLSYENVRVQDTVEQHFLCVALYFSGLQSANMILFLVILTFSRR